MFEIQAKVGTNGNNNYFHSVPHSVLVLPVISPYNPTTAYEVDFIIWILDKHKVEEILKPSSYFD